MRVYIRQANATEPEKELLPGIVVTLPNSTAKVSGNTLSVAMDAESIISGATAGKYVRTINGVLPDRNGDFLIEGSGCMSWSYTSQQINDVNLLSTVNDHGDVIPIPINGALLFADMCPSCTTCEYIYKLQHDVELMKLNINILKDISLYDETEVRSRLEDLSAYRVTGGANACGSFDDSNSLLNTKGAWLFREYVTMLHMWNYVVGINNASTVIQLAPESTAGFVVQTKHAVTSCDGDTTIRGKIDVTLHSCVTESNVPIAIPADYASMSVYIPDKSIRYTYGPFVENGSQVPGGQPGFDTLGNPTVAVGSVPSCGYAHKTVTTNVTIVEHAGTYMLEAKFVPFIPTELIAGATVNGTSITGGTIVTTENWSDIGGSAYPVIGSTTSTAYSYRLYTRRLAAKRFPTRQDYMNSNIAPMSVEDFGIIWKVYTEWVIGGSTHAQTYLYRCNAIGKPCSDVLTADYVIDDRAPEQDT